MSIGSIGSIRSTLGPVETQPVQSALREQARTTSAGTKADTAASGLSGESAFARPGQPWALWPPYVPPPAGEPSVGGSLLVSPLPPPPPEPDNQELQVSPLPPPDDGPQGLGGLVVAPLPPPVPEAPQGGLVVSPLPVPVDSGRGGDPGLVVSPYPVPPDFPDFAPPVPGEPPILSRRLLR